MKSKRQILVGLAGIAAGVVSSEITNEEAIKFIQNDQKIIKSTVEENKESFYRWKIICLLSVIGLKN